jgi:hypothetical protein
MHDKALIFADAGNAFDDQIPGEMISSMEKVCFSRAKS